MLTTKTTKNAKSLISYIEISFVIPARHRPPEAGSGEAGEFVHFVVKLYPVGINLLWATTPKARNSY
jgi:hypothetical protein